MKIILILFILNLYIKAINQTFIENQKKYQQVAEAIHDKQSTVEVILSANNLAIDNFELYIRIFKKERQLELWGKSIKEKKWQLLNIYNLCIQVPNLGPRLNKIDELPEGIYYVENFEPQSGLYLAIKINYPNTIDNYYIKNNTSMPSVHICGQCFSSGNFGVGESNIKEIYLFTIYATSNGQSRIPVHIFPCRMNETNYNLLIQNEKKYENFWKGLSAIYSFFENNKIIPDIILNSDGTYGIK